MNRADFERDYPPSVREAAALLLAAQADVARTMTECSGGSLDYNRAAVNRASELLTVDSAFRRAAQDALSAAGTAGAPAAGPAARIEAEGGYVGRWRVRSGDVLGLFRDRDAAVRAVRRDGGLPERLPWPVEVEADYPHGVRPCDVGCGAWLLAVAQDAGPDLCCPRCGREAEA